MGKKEGKENVRKGGQPSLSLLFSAVVFMVAIAVLYMWRPLFHDLVFIIFYRGLPVLILVMCVIGAILWAMATRRKEAGLGG